MNRYISIGLVDDAIEGNKVAFCGMAPACHEAFEMTAYHVKDMDVIIRRTNGAQSIEFPEGGLITFHSHPAELRNRQRDVVYLSDPSQPWINEALIAARGGEVIRP